MAAGLPRDQSCRHASGADHRRAWADLGRLRHLRISRRDRRRATARRAASGCSRARPWRAPRARRLVDWFHRKFHDEVTAYLVEEKVYRRHRPEQRLARHGGDAGRAHENLRYHLAYIGHLAETRQLARGRATELRRSRRRGASLGARLSRRGALGDYEPVQELVCAAQVETVVPAACLPTGSPASSRRGTYADLDF